MLAENPQQDEENLLRLREADGEGSRLASVSGRVLAYLGATLTFSICARRRIRPATTGLTDWQWPS